MAVNLSGVQLSRPDLDEWVVGTLARHGVAPDRLRLELTEGALVHGLESAASALARLRTLGVQVYLDDFGTGFSSLAYLSKLPVDVLKVDRSFVACLTSDPGAPRMVRMILNLAADLGLGVIAEGVEQQEQLDLLQAMGCRYAQGFLLGEPLDEDVAERRRNRAGVRKRRRPPVPTG